MDDLESKLSSIMSNPELMQQIMSMAQSFGQQEQPPAQEASAMPQLDLQTIQKLSGLAGQAGIDKKQHDLLRALTPFLNSHRIQKLENAMRAAKMAKLASTLIGR